MDQRIEKSDISIGLDTVQATKDVLTTNSNSQYFPHVPRYTLLVRNSVLALVEVVHKPVQARVEVAHKLVLALVVVAHTLVPALVVVVRRQALALVDDTEAVHKSIQVQVLHCVMVHTQVLPPEEVHSL